MTITPSPQQASAIRAIVDWYRDPHRQQPVFRLFGYAGSGKSTITMHAIEALGLTSMSRDGSATGGVLFAAFTGKAALVMTRKGTPASTIHSLIYRVSEATPEEIARIEQEAAALRASLGSLPPAEQLFAMERLKRLELRLSPISTSHALYSTSNRWCARPTSSCSTRSPWSGPRWRLTFWPSANRSWCWAIPVSCRRSRVLAPSPTQHPT
jgi:AAA domain